MKTLTIAAAVLVGLAFAMPAHADHGCNGTIIEVDAGDETLYVEHRSTTPGTIDVWLYLESNGIDGYQSGGEVRPLEDGIFWAIIWDPCLHANPDTLLV